MSLKNVLIIVDNIDESIDFYEELFGLRVITRQEGNVIMSEGLVLQDVDVWYDSTKIHTTPHNNMTELYFEDNDIEGYVLFNKQEPQIVIKENGMEQTILQFVMDEIKQNKRMIEDLTKKQIEGEIQADE